MEITVNDKRCQTVFRDALQVQLTITELTCGLYVLVSLQRQACFKRSCCSCGQTVFVSPFNFLPSCGCMFFPSLQYQDVNGRVLMHSIHFAARRAFDGEILLKQQCEPAVDCFRSELIDNYHCMTTNYLMFRHKDCGSVLSLLWTSRRCARASCLTCRFAVGHCNHCQQEV